jgi:hypothetical protein
MKKKKPLTFTNLFAFYLTNVLYTCWYPHEEGLPPSVSQLLLHKTNTVTNIVTYWYTVIQAHNTEADLFITTLSFLARQGHLL